MSDRAMPTVLICAGLVLAGAALAQPPAPGGGSTSGAPGPGPGGGTAQPSPTFVLNMCNKTPEIPVVYGIVLSTVGQQFRLQGWFQAQQGQCLVVGNFQRPTIWWHIREPKGVTWGQNPAVNLCVNLNDRVDLTWDGASRTCTQAETLLPFYKTDIRPTDSAHTINLE